MKYNKFNGTSKDEELYNPSSYIYNQQEIKSPKKSKDNIVKRISHGNKIVCVIFALIIFAIGEGLLLFICLHFDISPFNDLQHGIDIAYFHGIPNQVNDQPWSQTMVDQTVTSLRIELWSDLFFTSLPGTIIYTIIVYSVIKISFPKIQGRG